jgi:protein-disulfide isomerase
MAQPFRRIALVAAVFGLLAAGPVAAAPKVKAAPAPAPAAAAGGIPADAVSGDMSLGNPKAKVQVLEYASAACPHCAHFNEETFPAFKAKYVDTGRVHYTLKEYLTPPADVAVAGFLLARCGGKAKYFTILDQVFRSQARWGKEDLGDIFFEIGAKNGLSKDKVDACFGDQAALAAMKTRVMAAVNIDKIESTPTFVVNGKKVEGAVPLSDLDAAIAEAEKAAPKTGPTRKTHGKAGKR